MNNNIDDVFLSSFRKKRWSKPFQINQQNNVPDILPQLSNSVNGGLTVSWQQWNENGYDTISKTLHGKKWFKQFKNQAKSSKEDARNALKDLGNKPSQMSDFIPRGSFYLQSPLGNKSHPFTSKNGILSESD